MPKKLSASVHRNRGSFRANLHTDNVNFAPILSLRPPTHLIDKVSRAEWKRAAGLLADQGLLQQTDVAVLESYCIAYSEWRKALALLQEQGSIVNITSRTRNGTTTRPATSPLVGVAQSWQRAMLASAKLLGFSPADRKRIDAPPEPPEDDQNYDPFAIREEDDSSDISDEDAERIAARYQRRYEEEE